MNRLICCIILCCSINTALADKDECKTRGRDVAHICNNADLDRGKINVCHVPPGCPENEHTICVSQNAVDNDGVGHFPGEHGGDYYGVCLSDQEVTPTPVPTQTSTPTVVPSVSVTPTVVPSVSVTPTVVPTRNNSEKVKICHLTGLADPRAINIEVDIEALPGHIQHGDRQGACVFDCAGAPFGEATVDSCGVCGGDGSSCSGCDGESNSGKVLDSCGVCGGQNNTCLDCSGVPNGGKKTDSCGICGGDGSSCVDCLGIPNGPNKPDSCGVCGGNNSCLDCSGIPNGGTLIDKCGVCGGPGGQTVSFKDTKETLERLSKTIFNKKTIPYYKTGLSCSKKSGNKKLSKKFGKEILESKLVYDLFVSTLNELKLDVEVCPGDCALLENEVTINKLLKLNKSLYSYASKAQHGARDACKNRGLKKAITKIISNKLDKEIKKCPSGKICK